MATRLFLILLLTLMTGSCATPLPMLDQIRQVGELVVITRSSPAAYFRGPEGTSGVEYELVRLFAAELKVNVRFLIADSIEDILDSVATGEAHIAAAGLTLLPDREPLVRFGPPYQEITQQLVYHRARRGPKLIADVLGADLEVIAESSHEAELERLETEYPDLSWESHTDLDSGELLHLVQERLIDYTVADSNELLLYQHRYPELRSAFDLSGPQPIAWALAHSQDASLYRAVRGFFERIQEDGRLSELLDRYYGNRTRLSFVDRRDFRRHLAMRLPPLIPLFRQAAKATGLDWRLLAAIGYQESHWDPKAVSPTGVRGIMMLTRDTARQLGVKDRRDPKQSIMGGARYIRVVEAKIPERIPEPDRLWLTLAGYNIGFGHLEDARIITQRQGGDPDKWSDVRERLPLLAKKKWHQTTRHGYARGQEPVKYVDNVRTYFEMLRWRFPAHLPSAEAPYGLEIDPVAL